MDIIIANKTQTIERCLVRIDEERVGADDLSSNLSAQDAITLNLQRACEAAIDLAAHLVRVKKLGVANTNKEFFDLLSKAGLIDEKTDEAMKKMVGFRNIAIHDYTEINFSILQSILDKHLSDFSDFTRQVLVLA